MPKSYPADFDEVNSQATTFAIVKPQSDQPPYLAIVVTYFDHPQHANIEIRARTFIDLDKIKQAIAEFEAKQS